MRSSGKMLLLAVVTACGRNEVDLSLAPGPPASFRLARVYDRWRIGIDLEMRVPSGYEGSSMPFSRTWLRRNDPSISVTTDPRDQATFELPCGAPHSSGSSRGVAQRIERTDDLTVICEKQSEGKVEGFHVVRLVRNIDTVIQCSVRQFNRASSPRLRAEAISICASLRVLGRSEAKTEDWLPASP